MQSYAILVYSNSKYHDVLDIFFKQLVHHCHSLSSTLAPEIIVLSDQKPQFTLYDYPDGTAVKVKDLFPISWFEYSEAEPYWCHITSALSSNPLAKYQYVLFMQDDFFIDASFNLNSLERLIDDFSHIPGLAFIRTHPSGHELYSHNQPNKFERVPITYNHKYYFIHPLASYPYSMQATMWKSSDFYNYVFAARQEKVWNEGCIAYAYAMVKLKILGLSSKSLLIPYISTAVEKGRWATNRQMANSLTNQGRETVSEILAKYNIDPKIRGFQE